ncbi:Superoxide dismutase, copper/zinc binding domain [Dillenia turbinata]|uniref:superoxide dismutase n=1 Tax=Dillenia turbinata TaxID=194707 RepID=A0AAN8W3R3_9MAGN
MQAVIAARAAQTVLTAFPSQLFLFYPQLNPAFTPISVAVAAETKTAVAIIKGGSQIQGLISLSQPTNGPTTVNVRVTGLKPGSHGFHLHEFGGTTNGCISTGSHFNPNKLKHGAPKDKIRHAGDLGNIVANADGIAETTIVDNQIPLSGPNAIIVRAFVVHELEDDLGKGGVELSLPTGNAGGRLACGVPYFKLPCPLSQFTRKNCICTSL